MKEVYRSFGVLDMDCHEGYVIYELKNGLLEISSENIDLDKRDARFRVPKELLSEDDYGNLEKLGALEADAMNGCYENAQTFYNGKWYSGKTIREIQKKNKDLYWQRHV